MMTARQYEESLRKLKLEVYMFGKRIENVVDDPIIRPSMNAVAATYELAQRLEFADLMTAVSHLSGKRINRFCHIHQNRDDLTKKSKMGRMLGGHTACCFQRCVGMDALNALSIVAYDIDAKYRHTLQRTLPEIPGPCSGKRPDLRRRDDGSQGRQKPRPPSAARPGSVPACGGRKIRRHRSERGEGPPDRCGELP